MAISLIIGVMVIFALGDDEVGRITAAVEAALAETDKSFFNCECPKPV